MIKISGLTKTYPSGAKAVDRLDLSVAEGEILALLGPNGAGKSTTIRVLTTLSGFDDGQVTVAGYDIDRDPDAVRRSIGYVAQETGVDYFLTGRENLVLQGRLYRMKRADIEARVSELASYFSLTEHLDQLVSSYSGGMRRKLDIATALIHRPRVLFLDEPTLGLDTQSRQSLWQYIRKLNDELRLTILLTTHYLEEADRLSHRVAIIANGQIKVIGTAESLKDAIQGDAVTVEFEHNDDKSHWLAQQLRAEDYVRDLTWENNKLHLYVTNGAAAVPRVMEKATAANVRVKNIAFARPTLDDIFIKHTGASIQGNKETTGGAWWEKWAGKGGGKWAKQWQDSESKDSPVSATVQPGETSPSATPNPNQTWSGATEQRDSSEESKTESQSATAQTWPSDQWDPESVKKWQSQWPEQGGDWPKDSQWQNSSASPAPTTDLQQEPTVLKDPTRPSDPSDSKMGQTWGNHAPEHGSEQSNDGLLGKPAQASNLPETATPAAEKAEKSPWPSDQWDPESTKKWQSQWPDKGGDWPKGQQ